MQDVLRVDVVDCLADLQENVQLFPLGERVVFDVIREVALFLVLHDQVEVLSILQMLKEPHYVRVVLLCVNVYFLPDVAQALLITLFYYLNREVLARLLFGDQNHV